MSVKKGSIVDLPPGFESPESVFNPDHDLSLVNSLLAAKLEVRWSENLVMSRPLRNAIV